jgi:exonuclease SbcD
VVVTLTDKGAVHEPMARLREIYPNTLHIERVEAQDTTPGRFVGKDHRSLDLSEHFSTFFEGVTGEPLDGDERALLTEVLAELKVPTL